MPPLLPSYALRTRLLSSLLALLVLATSVGLTAERHRCRISGRSTVALLLPGQAPPGDDTPAAPGRPGKPCGRKRTTGCCDVTHVLHKLDAKSQAGPAAKLLPAPPMLVPPALLPVPAWAGLAPARTLASGVAAGQAANSSPPGVPRAGRVLLTWVGTLVV